MNSKISVVAMAWRRESLRRSSLKFELSEVLRRNATSWITRLVKKKQVSRILFADNGFKMLACSRTIYGLSRTVTVLLVGQKSPTAVQKHTEQTFYRIIF